MVWVSAGEKMPLSYKSSAEGRRTWFSRRDCAGCIFPGGIAEKVKQPWLGRGYGQRGGAIMAYGRMVCQDIAHQAYPEPESRPCVGGLRLASAPSEEPWPPRGSLAGHGMAPGNERDPHGRASAGGHSEGSRRPKPAGVAAGWYRKAAEQGYADGQFNLGWCYENGRGVPRDLDEARRWYRKAAAQGHADARKRLAELD
jgi:hypothetical protein